MPRATAIRQEKVIDDDGNILEVVIWRVPVTPRSPVAVRYRLAFIRKGEARPVVLYDNHPPKGHHRHIGGVEGTYTFVDVDQLLSDFIGDVRRMTGEDRWPRH